MIPAALGATWSLLSRPPTSPCQGRGGAATEHRGHPPPPPPPADLDIAQVEGSLGEALISGTEALAACRRRGTVQEKAPGRAEPRVWNAGAAQCIPYGCGCWRPGPTQGTKGGGQTLAISCSPIRPLPAPPCRKAHLFGLIYCLSPLYPVLGC